MKTQENSILKETAAKGYTHPLLLDQRSIDLGGAQKKKVTFIIKLFERFEMRYHMPYLLHLPKIPLLRIRLIPNPQ